jgi:hypothetical protein
MMTSNGHLIVLSGTRRSPLLGSVDCMRGSRWVLSLAQKQNLLGLLDGSTMKLRFTHDHIHPGNSKVLAIQVNKMGISSFPGIDAKIPVEPDGSGEISDSVRLVVSVDTPDGYSDRK